MKLADVAAAMKKYMEIRTRRLDLDKQSEALKAEESMLRDLVKKEMMGRLDKHGTIFQPEGMKIKAEIKMRASSDVFDWTKLQQHIIKTGEFDLLHQRVTETAVRQRWEAGQEVPGIRQVQTPEISITKVKE